jgi:hypothetical protein
LAIPQDGIAVLDLRIAAGSRVLTTAGLVAVTTTNPPVGSKTSSFRGMSSSSSSSGKAPAGEAAAIVVVAIVDVVEARAEEIGNMTIGLMERRLLEKSRGKMVAIREPETAWIGGKWGSTKVFKEHLVWDASICCAL